MRTRQCHRASRATSAAVLLAHLQRCAFAAAPAHAGAELRIPCRSGASLAARAWGDADAPLRVLALHGWMDNANSWELLGPAVGASCRVVALDLPGHGLSPHAPSSAEYTQVEHAYAAYDALDALGWLEREGGFSLLGHSMGGGVCCLLAAALPEHVRRLALVEGFGPLSRPPDAFAPQLRDALRKRHAAAVGEGGARERTYRSLEDAAGTRVNGAKRLPGNQYMSLDAALALARRGTVAATDDGGALRFAHDRRLSHPVSQGFHEEQVLAVLRAIGCATMLVQAADGWPRPEPGFSTRLLAMQPGLLRVVELDEGSHYAHLDPATSGKVQAAIVPFLLEQC